MLPAHQNPLFPYSEIEKRKMSTQTDFEQANHSLLMEYPMIVGRSFVRLAKEIFAMTEIISRDRNLAAVAVSGYMRGELITLFPEYCTKATKGRFKMNSVKGEWLYVKKLTSKKKPMNINTTANGKILNQISESPADVEQNVFIGYTASKDMTHVTGVYAVCIDGNKIVWDIDLIQYVVYHTTSTASKTLTQKAQTKLKDGIVEIKKAK